MINLVVVAGEQTKELCNHLEHNCSFGIVYQTQSFAQNREKIKNNIIKADKLLYVYQNQFMNIRSDMAFLRDLFLADSFFKVNEVIFIQKKDADSDQAERYYLNVMQEVSVALKQKNRHSIPLEYSSKTIDGTLTFQAISETLLGISQEFNVKNSKAGFYRFEKGNNAKEIYNTDKAPNASVEAFSFDALTNYERERKNLSKLNNNTIKTDSKDSWEQFQDVNFDRLELNTEELERNVIIISGKSKTGKTSLTTALAQSTIEPMLVLDFTDNQDCDSLINSVCQKIDKVTVEDFMRGTMYLENLVAVMQIDVKYNDTLLDILTLLKAKLNKSFHKIIVVCEQMDLENITQALIQDVALIIYCVNNVEIEVELASLFLEDYLVKAKLAVLLNDNLLLNDRTRKITPEEARERLNELISIIKPIDFSKFEFDNDFYNGFMEVCND